MHSPKPAAKSAAAKDKAARGKVAAEQHRIDELERELSYTKENLHATIEEQQASNEELKSTNEEMQSTNEELQSTNEELETSKEELQSVNEELVTVNAELQNKIEQLAGMQNDMKNLLDNINIGTVFLNDMLNIKRFTREATQVYRLVASDVGRPLGDIKSDIKVTTCSPMRKPCSTHWCRANARCAPSAAPGIWRASSPIARWTT